MKLQVWSVMTASCLAATLATVTAAGAQRIIRYDAPNSGTGANQGTTSTGINLLGFVTGYVTDDRNATHGYVGIPRGKFEEFDVPGADPVAGGTFPGALNDFGLVAGYYADKNNAEHGFLRHPDGKIVAFDVAGAGTATYQGTVPEGMNDCGEVTGNYIDANNMNHGFLRTREGRMITFDDDAEAATGPYLGTIPLSINYSGFIVGIYLDAKGVSHGFLRTPEGRMKSFDVPAAVGGAIGTYTAFINDFGMIAGSYYDAKTNVEAGYVRCPDGKITTFSPPDSGTVAYSGANLYAIGLTGAVTGFTADNNFDAHAFVRYADGRSVTFSIRDQVQDAGNDEGSAGWAINAEGAIAGRWRDRNFALHGLFTFPENCGSPVIGRHHEDALYAICIYGHNHLLIQPLLAGSGERFGSSRQPRLGDH